MLLKSRCTISMWHFWESNSTSAALNYLLRSCTLLLVLYELCVATYCTVFMHLAEEIRLISILLNAARKNTCLKLCWQSWELLPFTNRPQLATGCVILLTMYGVWVHWRSRLVDNGLILCRGIEVWHTVTFSSVFLKKKITGLISASAKLLISADEFQFARFYLETSCKFGLISSF